MHTATVSDFSQLGVRHTRICAYNRYLQVMTKNITYGAFVTRNASKPWFGSVCFVLPNSSKSPNIQVAIKAYKQSQYMETFPFVVSYMSNHQREQTKCC